MKMKCRLPRLIPCVLFVLCFFCLISGAVRAESSGVMYTGVTWTLDDEGVLTISGTGAMDNWTVPEASAHNASFNDVPWKGKSIVRVIIEEGVTTVGNCAFAGQKELVSVEIPDTVTSIYGSAFEGCSSLASVRIPENVTFIGGSAFRSCTALSSVRIPAGVTSVGTDAFRACTALTEADVWASGVLTSTFMGCTSLRQVSLNGNVTSLNRTFSDTALETIALPDTVVFVNDYAFYRCTALREAVIPSSCTTLGTGAFLGCASLTEITVPASVNTMADQVFSGCTELQDIWFEGDLPKIPSYGTSSRRNVFSQVPGRVWCHCNPDNDTWNGVCSGNNQTFGTDVRYGRYGEGEDGFTWKLTDGVLTVEGSGTLTDATWHSRLDIQEIVFPETMTGIGIRLSDTGVPDEIALPGRITVLSDDALEGIGKVSCDPDSQTARTLGRIGRSFSCAEYPGLEFLWTGKGEEAKLELAGAELGNALVRIPEGIEAIPDYCFYSDMALETVILPSTLKEIGNQAFASCTSLVAPAFPDSLERIGNSAFSGCRGIRELTLPDGLRFIGDSAFGYSGNLTVSGIPASLTHIGAGAFAHVTFAGDVQITKDMTFGARPFDSAQVGNIIVEEGVTALQDELFARTSFGKLTLPDSLRSIGNDAFAWSSSEEKQALDVSGTEALGAGAFLGCSWLTEVTLPAIESVPSGIFTLCGSLAKVTVPEGVTAIGECAFQSCASLREMLLPETLTAIEGYAFDGCTALESVPLPDAITALGENAFSACIALKEIAIPDSVTVIPDFVFSGCEALEEVRLPDALTRIGYSAFSGCDLIQRLELAGSLTEIAEESLPANAVHLVTYGSYCAQRVAEMERKYLYRPFSPDSISATVQGSFLWGGTGRIEIKLTPSGLTPDLYDEPEFIFESGDESILTVTNEGYFKGRGAGKTTVTVRDRLNPAVCDTVEITITDKTAAVLGAFVRVTYNGGDSASVSYGAKAGVPPYDITLSVDSQIVKNLTDIEQNGSKQASFSTSVSTPAKQEFYKKITVTVKDAAGKQAAASGTCSLRKKTKRVGVGTPVVRMVRDEYGNMGYQYTYDSYRDEVTWEPYADSQDTLPGVMTSLSAVRELLLAVGERESLSVSASGSSVVFTTDDWHIADPNYDGTVTAVAPGGTTVYTRAVDGSGLVAATRVTVVEKRILAESLELFLNPECDQQLSWRFQPEDVTDPNVRFTVEDNSVLKVNDGGYLRFLKEGSTTVRAVAQDGSGVFAELEVSGSPAHSHIPLTQTKAQLSRDGQNGYSPRMTCAVCQAALCEDEIIRPDECITLPQALKTVEAEAFFGNRTAKQVYIPDGAERIGSAAFASSKLLLVRIPDSVTELAADAFDGCENLCIICPAGSAAAHFAQACRIAWVPEE